MQYDPMLWLDTTNPTDGRKQPSPGKWRRLPILAIVACKLVHNNVETVRTVRMLTMPNSNANVKHEMSNKTRMRKISRSKSRPKRQNLPHCLSPPAYSIYNPPPPPVTCPAPHFGFSSFRSAPQTRGPATQRYRAKSFAKLSAILFH